MKILIVVDAPGPAEFIFPVMPLLQKNNGILLVTVDQPTQAAHKILQKYNPTSCSSEEEAEPIYQKFNPDILLVGMSSLVLGPYVNKKFAELAHADGKKIISFQDFWANHRWPMNWQMLKFCNAVLTPDEMAKNFLEQDGYEGKIIITGNPAFDKFSDINVAAERKKLRQKFNLSEKDFVILHSGTGTPQSWQEDEVTFKFLAEVIRNFRNSSIPQLFNSKLIIISRPHPRDEQPNRYQKLAPDLNLLDVSSFGLTEEILPIADVVIAMYATNLIHSCYLRIPAISILLPNGGKKRLEKISLTDFPPNAVRATIGIYHQSTKELKEVLIKIINNQDYRDEIRKNQEKFFPVSQEQHAQKIVKAININLEEI